MYYNLAFIPLTKALTLSTYLLTCCIYIGLYRFSPPCPIVKWIISTTSLGLEMNLRSRRFFLVGRQGSTTLFDSSVDRQSCCLISVSSWIKLHVVKHRLNWLGRRNCKFPGKKFFFHDMHVWFHDMLVVLLK